MELIDILDLTIRTDTKFKKRSSEHSRFDQLIKIECLFSVMISSGISGNTFLNLYDVQDWGGSSSGTGLDPGS